MRVPLQCFYMGNEGTGGGMDVFMDLLSDCLNGFFPDRVKESGLKVRMSLEILQPVSIHTVCMYEPPQCLINHFTVKRNKP